MKRAFTLVALALALVACSPAPTPAPVPIPGATPADACTALAAESCPEGLDPKCVDVLTDMMQSRFIEQRAVGCLAASKSPAEARACKTVACKGVP